jgi:hypothetical protein
VTLETRAHQAADSVRERLEAIPVPSSSVVVRAVQGRRRRRYIAATAVLLAVAAAVTVPLLSRTAGTTRIAVGTQDNGAGLPAGSEVAGSWTMLAKKAAGLGSGTRLWTTAAGSDTLLVGGARPQNAGWTATVWRSTDATHWNQAQTPAFNGTISAIAIHGRTALAIGTASASVASTTVPFVWRSTDDGATWSAVASASDRFGAPRPAMGRPSIEGLMWFGGSWVASGGASNGYAGIWVSADGTHWTQTLPSNVAGSVSIVEDAHGGLFAYWAPFAWTTRDPRHWTPTSPLSLPSGYTLQNVAAGISVAIGQDPVYHKSSPLLVSGNHGRSWSIYPNFPGQAPGAAGLTILRTRGFTIVAGNSGLPNRPDAWVSSDLATWQALPDQLKGTPGGRLDLAAALNEHVALIGTAPELDRFYVLNLNTTTGR